MCYFVVSVKGDWGLRNFLSDFFALGPKVYLGPVVEFFLGVRGWFSVACGVALYSFGFSRVLPAIVFQ